MATERKYRYVAWLSAESTDGVYIGNADTYEINELLPWDKFCMDTFEDMSPALAQEWAVKLDELSKQLIEHAEKVNEQ